MSCSNMHHVSCTEKSCTSYHPIASVISFSAGNVFKGKGGPGSHILSLYIRSFTQRISPCLSRKTTNTLVCLLSCHTSQQSEALKKNVAKTGVAQFKTTGLHFSLKISCSLSALNRFWVPGTPLPARKFSIGISFHGISFHNQWAFPKLIKSCPWIKCKASPPAKVSVIIQMHYLKLVF